MQVEPLKFRPLPERPLVSVLIANYNYERYVCRAIESLQRQTWWKWEAVICDDGSNDRSADVIASYAAQDPRVRLLMQPNGGMASALNTAARTANGDLVALLDSDDEYDEQRLEAVVRRFREYPNAGTVCHLVRAINANGDVIKLRHPRRLAQGWLAQDMLAGVEALLPPCSGLTFRREVADRIFPLPARFRRCADKVAQDRAALTAEVASIDRPLALYRIHGANLTGLSGPVSAGALKSNIEFLEQLWTDRAEFVRTWHGIQADVRPWREVESAHFFLAARLLGEQDDPRVQASAIRSPLRRVIWRALLALPRRAGRAGLRFWWTEHSLKRRCRLTWDLLTHPREIVGRTAA